MNFNVFVDIIGRVFVMSYVWVFFIDYFLNNDLDIGSRLVIAMFIIYWSVIPYINKKVEVEEK